jgi:acyl-CoA thioesterase
MEALLSDPGLLAAASKFKGAPVDKNGLQKFTMDHALAVLLLSHTDHTKMG